MPDERSLATVLDGLFSGKGLASLLSCVKEQIGMAEISVSYRDVRVTFVKSGLTN